VRDQEMKTLRCDSTTFSCCLNFWILQSMSSIH